MGSTASTTVTKAGGFIQLSVTSGSANIAYFDVKAPATNDAGKPIAIDDLAITRPATPPPPDFTLGTTLPAVGMIAGDSVDVPIDVHRANGSNGNESLWQGGLSSARRCGAVRTQAGPKSCERGRGSTRRRSPCVSGTRCLDGRRQAPVVVVGKRVSASAMISSGGTGRLNRNPCPI